MVEGWVWVGDIFIDTARGQEMVEALARRQRLVGDLVGQAL